MDHDVDPSLGDRLQAALEVFVTGAGTKRDLPPRIHLGHPGGSHITVISALVQDAGLRADLVERALEGLEGELGLRAGAWITRSGELSATDDDVSWCAAARAGFGRHGWPLPGFFVMNRHGWLDLLTGEVTRARKVRAKRVPDADRCRRRADSSRWT